MLETSGTLQVPTRGEVICRKASSSCAAVVLRQVELPGSQEEGPGERGSSQPLTGYREDTIHHSIEVQAVYRNGIPVYRYGRRQYR